MSTQSSDTNQLHAEGSSGNLGWRISSAIRRHSHTQSTFSPPNPSFLSGFSSSAGSSSRQSQDTEPSTSYPSTENRFLYPRFIGTKCMSSSPQASDASSASTSHKSQMLSSSDMQNTTSKEPFQYKTRKVRLSPHIDSTRKLLFFPTEFEIEEGGRPIQIGRFSEKSKNPDDSNLTSQDESNMTETVSTSMHRTATHNSHRQPVVVGRRKICIAFQNKVVSRLHAELWCDTNGILYLRDTKSSSGTFVNRCRLSPPGVQSDSFRIHDHDLIQFGVDYRGGSVDEYRAIKLRFETNYNVNIPKRSIEYGQSVLQKLESEHMQKIQNGSSESTSPQSSTEKGKLSECCICLLKIRVSQALFISPCSHMFHFKCIRPMIQLHHPGFSCPLCRSFFDLEQDAQDDTDEECSSKEGVPLTLVKEPE